jgi:hypothetical protein
MGEDVPVGSLADYLDIGFGTEDQAEDGQLNTGGTSGPAPARS